MRDQFPKITKLGLEVRFDRRMSDGGDVMFVYAHDLENALLQIWPDDFEQIIREAIALGAKSGPAAAVYFGHLTERAQKLAKVFTDE